jgi:hypothetical protein
MGDNEDIETLFKVEPPFTDVPEGYGYAGVVLRNTKEDTLQCHICGEWFGSLSQHVFRAHKMKTEKYRKTYGLPLNHPLCSKALSDKFRKNADKNQNWLKGVFNPKDLAKTNKNKKWKKNTMYSKTCDAWKNKHATCDKQLLERFMIVSDMASKDPSVGDLREYDPGLYDVIRSRYGSVNKFRKKHAMTILREPNTKWDKNKLIGVLRAYYKLNGCAPKSKYYEKKKKGLPQKTTFFRVFGSWKRALSTASLI